MPGFEKIYRQCLWGFWRFLAFLGVDILHYLSPLLLPPSGLAWFIATTS
jgi:hypothetical protein